MSKTERYDVEEDLANDTKKHDNPNHEGHFKNELNDWEAQQQIKEWENGQNTSTQQTI